MLPIFLLTSLFAQAQGVDYNKIISPAGNSSADFGEKLVWLAWNNHPSNKTVQANVVVAKQELQLARWSWLERITVSGNLNEFTITGGPNEETRNRALFFPRYNVGISLSPSMIFSIPAEKRRAQEMLNVANFNVNEQKLLMRKEVLQRYQDYLMTKQMLEMETKLTESTTTAFQLTEERFKRGQVMLEAYNEAASTYMGQQRQRLSAETNYIKAKLELEALIGMRLEDVR